MGAADRPSSAPQPVHEYFTSSLANPSRAEGNERDAVKLVTSIYMGKQWMDELDARYQRGEINKTQYLIAKGQLQDKIKSGRAIKRTPLGIALKVVLAVILIASGGVTIYLVPGLAGFIWGGVLIASAVPVLIMP